MIPKCEVINDASASWGSLAWGGKQGGKEMRVLLKLNLINVNIKIYFFTRH